MAKSEKGAGKEGKKSIKYYWAAFMHWYESYKGKRIVGVVYSVGAAVVIVGALFKIQHWPGAAYVLTGGMVVEALLFVIGALDKPHPEFNWSNVFPQLLEYGTDPAILEEKSHQARPTLLGAGVEGGADGGIVVPAGGVVVAAAGVPATAVKASNVPSLNEKEMQALQDGITDLAKTATQLSELGKVATATHQLTSKMEAAGEAAEKFAASQTNLLNVSSQLGETYQAAEANMQKAAETTKGFVQDIASVGSKLSTLNSIYELQINALQEQVEVAKAQTSTLGNVSGSLQAIEAQAAEAQKNHEAYTAATKKLASQVADLNSIYGNMLNALA